MIATPEDITKIKALLYSQDIANIAIAEGLCRALKVRFEHLHPELSELSKNVHFLSVFGIDYTFRKNSSFILSIKKSFISVSFKFV